MTRPRFELGIVRMARLECYRYGKSPLITCLFCTVKNSWSSTSISPYVFMVRCFVEKGRTLIPRHRLSYEKLRARFVYKTTLTLCSPLPPPPAVKLYFVFLPAIHACDHFYGISSFFETNLQANCCDCH